MASTCYRSSELAACEVVRLHLVDSRSTDTWTVPTLGGAIDDPLPTSSPNMGPVSAGSRGMGPTCYGSSGLVACEVLWLQLFDSRSTAPWPLTTLGPMPPDITVYHLRPQIGNCGEPRPVCNV